MYLQRNYDFTVTFDQLNVSLQIKMINLLNINSYKSFWESLGHIII